MKSNFWFRFLKISFMILLALCSSNAVILDCVYSYRTNGVVGNLYTCTARVLPSSSGRYVYDVSHNHLDDHDNSDVKSFIIDQTAVDFTPRNISNFFPNLIVFTAYNRNLSELTRESLAGLGSLRLFDFGNNNLRIIEQDLFEENLLIERLYFESNPIRYFIKIIWLPLAFIFFVLQTCCIQCVWQSAKPKLLAYG